MVPERGGAADIADPGLGETYEPGDSDSFCEAVLNMISRDRNDLVEATKNAAENDIVTMEGHFRMLFETYQELLDTKDS